ncbi:MAG: ParA family protein [Deltaproteobacteria bacterium]|jgi:chromosome partitioning protein|nr:ParA family protein [Deltaproteobacteria bacterium]
MSIKLIAIANQKGGVGKTTTTLTLATALTQLDKRVLVLDLDPHACASLHMRLYPENQSHTLHDLFMAAESPREDIWKNIIKEVHARGLHLAPASIRLSELEIDLRDRRNKGGILADALKSVRDDYDYVLMDCPPHVGVLLVNALVACELLVIPIQTDFLALYGLKLLFDTMRTLNKVLPAPIRYMALPTMYDRRARACTRVLELLQEKMGTAMFNTIIGVDTRLREASAQGCVIYDLDPQSRGALAYTALAKEIMAL